MGDCLMSMSFPFEMMKIYWHQIETMVAHNTVHVLNAIESYTLKWLMVNFYVMWILPQ